MRLREPRPRAPVRAVLPMVAPALLLFLSLSAAPGHAAAQAARNIEWNEVTWAEGEVRIALVRPDPATEGPHPVVFALPWGAGTAVLVQTFVGSYWSEEAPSRGYYVVSPVVHGPSLERTASDLLPAIFDWMAAELDYDPERVALVGASNGGRGAFFAALAEPDRFGALMVLPGQYAGPADDLAVLDGKDIYFLVGQRDQQWVDGTLETRAALGARGIPSGLWIAPGQGHVISIDPRFLMDWLDSALDRP